jgi:DnaJ-class molecular chaperone
MGQQDYYNILGVDETASAEDIKEAFRKLALKYHPDRNQNNPGAAEKMKSLNEAYAVLSNPGKRKEYDALKRQFGSTAYTHFRSSYTDQDIFRGSDINKILEELAQAFGVRGHHDLFREFYGNSYQSFEFGRPGFFAKGFVFGKAFEKGNQEQISRKTPFQKHVGNVSRFFLEKMTGMEYPEQGADIQDTIRLTPELAHDGGPYAYFHRQKKKRLVVKIPPRIREGQRIRLAKMGHEGKGGANAGNLYLEIQIKKPFLKKIKDFLPSLWSK